MRKLLSFMLVLVLVLTPLAANAAPSSTFITTTPTGYDSANDVVYKTASVSGRTVIYNWGARGEVCEFLSKYVDGYYTDGYDTMASYTGGTSTSNVTSSQMYQELKELMTDSHTFYTYYDGNKNVRSFYKYTDCVSNDTSKVALFYRGGLVSSAWDSGNTWNQEHCAPRSKLSGSQQIGDIMHLRPSNPSENSSRGNKTYGTRSGNYDPGVSVRGDCARMMLYMHVRWGTNLTSLIESVDLMLQWMKEDPVDTWEMARNDSVQSITGVRNVFVDYPELAFLMFSKSVPQDMSTPSGYAKNGTGSTIPTPCKHASTEVRGWKGSTCTVAGYTGDTYCKSCGIKIATGSNTPLSEHKDNNGDGKCDACGTRLVTCDHRTDEVRNKKDATCTEDGYTGDTYCLDCGEKLVTGETVVAPGHKDLDQNSECDSCSNRAACDHRNVEIRNRVDAGCTQSGYTGDDYCTDCKTVIALGKTIPEVHIDGDRNFVCDACGATIMPPATEPTEKPTSPSTEAPAQPTNPADLTEENNFLPTTLIIVGIAVIFVAAIVVIIIIKKKKESTSK